MYIVITSQQQQNQIQTQKLSQNHFSTQQRGVTNKQLLLQQPKISSHNIVISSQLVNRTCSSLWIFRIVRITIITLITISFLDLWLKKPQNAIQNMQENNINFRQRNITQISDIQHELQIIVQKMNFDKVNQIMAEYIKNEKLYNLPNKPPKQQIQAPIQEIQQENKKNDFETLQFVVQNAQNAVQVLKQNKIHFVQGTTSKINNFQEKIVIYVYQIASIDQVYEIMDQFIQNEYLQQSQINKAKLIQNQQQNQVKPKSHPQKPAHSSTLTQTQNFNVQTAPETELKSEIKVEPKTEEESVSIVIENSSVSISIDLEDS
ncbi:Hypothetical_protein [Hexamita inflata]|uniref:Hypothetical_protein n=1 Tax=Hexamita inflata TaxID=28002 RepID=A0AA86NIC5_9EUKA|nr:Hypothetical protein HINF_LOCUS7253 [Hexamita inflata]